MAGGVDREGSVVLYRRITPWCYMLSLGKQTIISKLPSQTALAKRELGNTAASVFCFKILMQSFDERQIDWTS